MKSIGYFFLVYILLNATMLNAAELAYKFQIGQTYKYKYENRINSKMSVLEKATQQNKKNTPIEFSIKAIAFDNNAFITDINSNGKTTRRYIKPNGELKGSPAEAGQHFPFFLTFPNEDLAIDSPYNTSHTVVLGKKEFQANRTLILKSYDETTGIAELTFRAIIKLPEVKTGKKALSLNGKFSFNVIEGILINASWVSKYSFGYFNKESAISRDLWNFEHEQKHAIILTKVEE